MKRLSICPSYTISQSSYTYPKHLQHPRIRGLHTDHTEILAVLLLQTVRQLSILSFIFISCGDRGDGGARRKRLGHARAEDLLREARPLVVDVVDDYGHRGASCKGTVS